METIQSLRKKGYKVRVIHTRHWVRRSDYPHYDIFEYTKRELDNRDNAFMILGKGGKTVIEVTEPFKLFQQKTVKGEAACSKKDNFNRKIGNAIALGRALSQLQ